MKKCKYLLIGEDMNLSVINIDKYDFNLISEAINQIFDELHINIAKGSKVFIKPNLIRDINCDKAATTHPLIVQAVAEKLIKEYNCKVTIGDSSGGTFNAGFMNSVYRVSGMTKAAENANCQLNTDFSSSKVSLNNVNLAKIDIINAFLDADVVINLAKFKTHSFTAFTGACKNLFGLIPGLIKVELHSRFPQVEEFTDFLIDLVNFAAPKIALNIVDGIIGMEGAGPTNGTPRYVGKLFASTNPYLVDLACVCNIYDISEVPLIVHAIDKGLITEDMLNDDIVKQQVVEKIQNYKIVPVKTFMKSLSKSPSWTKRFFKKQVTDKAIINRSKCKGCGKCVTHCPKQAVTITKHIAKINQKNCIRCYCCQELCAYDAVKLKRTLVGKIFSKLSNIKR